MSSIEKEIALLKEIFKSKYESDVKKHGFKCDNCICETKKKTSKIILTETQEAQKLANYLRLNNYVFSHIPNERKTSFKQGRILKSVGVMSGFPDYLVFLKKYVIAIELKRSNKSLSRVSENQKTWIDKLNSFDYCIAKVCYGFNEAKDFLESLNND